MLVPAGSTAMFLPHTRAGGKEGDKESDALLAKRRSAASRGWVLLSRVELCQDAASA